jgi:hypothetical protein
MSKNTKSHDAAFRVFMTAVSSEVDGNPMWDLSAELYGPPNEDVVTLAKGHAVVPDANRDTELQEGIDGLCDAAWAYGAKTIDVTVRLGAIVTRVTHSLEAHPRTRTSGMLARTGWVQ